MNLRDDFVRRSRSTAAPEGPECPRVVIFDGEGEPRVEIVDLPDVAAPGDFFCHCGTRWQVTATRTGDRVLIAQPIEA
ncbi:MAG: hypothetical protein QNL88_17500 [Acidobacteriota bacterium]|nr:hypothetical protein [Acidobacteriota bacterium]